MGWEMPWYTLTDDFDADFGVDEWHGTNAFIRDGNSVFRTYFINNRGDEAMGSTWSYLDMTALGRQEEWEDSPRATPGPALRVVDLARRTTPEFVVSDVIVIGISKFRRNDETRVRARCVHGPRR